MRKPVPWCLVILSGVWLIISARASHAADNEGRWGVGLHGGVYKLGLTDHTDAWTVGWLVNGDVKYGLTPKFSIGAEGSFMRTYLADLGSDPTSGEVMDGAGLTFDKVDDGPKQRAYIAGLFGEYQFTENSTWTPYVSFGAGMYMWKYTDKDGNTLMSVDEALQTPPKTMHVPPLDLAGNPYELKDHELYVMGGAGMEYYPSGSLSFEAGLKFRYLTHAFSSFTDEKDIVGSDPGQLDLPRAIGELTLGLTYHFGAGGCPPGSASATATPTDGAVPLEVQFTSTFTGGCPDYTYLWDFGDGSTSTEQNPRHTYGTEGAYTASLEITDARGKKLTDNVAVTTKCAPLSATAKGDPPGGTAPLVVAFEGHVTGGCPPFSYVWEFGDAGTSADQSPQHEYPAEGQFTATLTVRDGKGATSEARVPVTVSSSFVPGADQALVLEGVNFKSGTAALLPESAKILDGVAQALIAQPDVKIEIGGHTDADGHEASNLKLSQRRADTVKNYLVKKGVPASRMTAKGYGELHPVADNKSPEGKAKNRRVELKRM